MAATTDEIVTIAQLKSALRIPPSATSQDELLQDQIESGIAYVSRRLIAPLVDATLTVDVEPATGDNTLSFDGPGLKSVKAVSYWTAAAALRDEPNGTIAASDLGRVNVGKTTHSVYPPAAGWPPVLSGSKMRVSFVVGIADDQLPAARQAVISYVRHAYDGFREVKRRESFVQLSRSLRL